MKEILRHKQLFNISDKKVTIYPSPVPDRPIVYLNTFAEEGEQVNLALCDVILKDFTMVTISNLDWNHDMTPWEIPPIFQNDMPCSGGADEYLRLLTNEIVPAAEELVPGHVLWRGLAGYSLGGLFAIYSLYQTNLFSRIASMSGSLWFPGFKKYVFSREMKCFPDYLYLSLGNRECKTRNPYLKTVQANTEEIAAFYAEKGLNTLFQLNQGNHHQNAVQRTVSGISWLLEQSKTPPQAAGHQT